MEAEVGLMCIENGRSHEPRNEGKHLEGGKGREILSSTASRKEHSPVGTLGHKTHLKL